MIYRGDIVQCIDGTDSENRLITGASYRISDNMPYEPTLTVVNGVVWRVNRFIKSTSMYYLSNPMLTNCEEIGIEATCDAHAISRALGYAHQYEWDSWKLVHGNEIVSEYTSSHLIQEEPRNDTPW